MRVQTTNFFVCDYLVASCSIFSILFSGLVMPLLTASILPFSADAPAHRRRHRTPFAQPHHENCARVRASTRRRSFSLRRFSMAILGSASADDDADGDEMRARPASETLMSGKFTFSPSTIDAAGGASAGASGSARARRAELGHEQRVSRELKTTVESIAFIANHLKSSISDKSIRDDWKFVSAVLDRLLLLVFFGITLGGTIKILLSAPHVFEYVDQQEIVSCCLIGNLAVCAQK